MKFNDILVEVGDHVDVKHEVKRLADHWRKNKKSMSKDELVDAIGHDLEMLEYSPEEVERVVPMVLKAISGV